MRTEVRITGIGGQGAISMGHVLGMAAVLYDGKEAVVTEGYSPYITGGWSRADVVISDEPIDYPAVSELDALVTMYQDGLDTNLKLLRKRGIIVAEKRLVTMSGSHGGRAYSVPAAEAADGLGKKVLTNVVLLGSLVAITRFVSKSSVEKALADRFPRAVELNIRALSAGHELGSRLVAKGGTEK